ncbi:MAG: anti-sigma factor [Aggregatilineales bacterium]
MENRNTNDTAANCDGLRDLIPAYCLGALDADERQRVERELPACPELAAEVAGCEALAQLLLHSVPQTAPPPGLRAALLRAASPVSAAAPRRRALGWLLAVAGLLVALVVSNLLWFSEVSRLRAARLTDRGQPLLLGSGVPERLELAAPDASASAANLVWVAGPGSDTWVAWLVARQFPPLAEGQVYQVWLTRTGEAPRSAGLFTVDAAGNGALVFEIAEPIESFNRVGVTAEPAGGSPGPTSAPVVRVEF